MTKHTIKTTPTKGGILGDDLVKATERIEKNSHVYERVSVGYNKKEAIEKNENKPFRQKR
jgi:hypothetical protein